MRVKRRYILIEFLEKQDKESFEKEFLEIFATLFGKLDLCFSGIKIIEINENYCILRCNLEYLNKVRACVFYFGNYGKLSHGYIKKVSGSLKKIRSFIASIYLNISK
jgi:RNase P/RNase MRP subunit POP5